MYVYMLLFVRNMFAVLTVTEPHPASFVTANSNKYVTFVEPRSSTIGPAIYAMTRDYQRSYKQLN
jgi:hypothetical protein